MRRAMVSHLMLYNKVVRITMRFDRRLMFRHRRDAVNTSVDPFLDFICQFLVTPPSHAMCAAPWFFNSIFFIFFLFFFGRSRFPDMPLTHANIFMNININIYIIILLF